MGRKAQLFCMGQAAVCGNDKIILLQRLRQSIKPGSAENNTLSHKFTSFGYSLAQTKGKCKKDREDFRPPDDFISWHGRTGW